MKYLILFIITFSLNAEVIFIRKGEEATCNHPKVIHEIIRILKDETGTVVQKIEVIELENNGFRLCQGILTIKNKLYKITFYTNGPNGMSSATRKGYAVDVFNMHRNTIYTNGNGLK